MQGRDNGPFALRMKDVNLKSEEQVATGPVVLLADTNRWPVAARVAMGLAGVGCEVSGICPTPGHPLQKVSVVRRIFPYSGLRPLESLAAAIEATKPQIIIPCDDRAVQHLHELHARAGQLEGATSSLAALIERSLGPSESFRTVTSRHGLLTTARAEGIRIPATQPVTCIDDLRSWRERQALPWVLKADGTSGGRGVRIAQSVKQAEQFFLEMVRPYGLGRAVKRLCINRDPFWFRPWWKETQSGVIVQEHIEGRPANCAVVCWEGKVLAGIGVEVVSAEGLTGPATVVRVVENREMTGAAERVARRLRLTGFFGLDFVVEETQRAAYLVEMNPRCTPLCHLQLGKGRDMVGALWAQLSNQRPPDIPPITQNDVIAYFPQAWNCQSEFLQSSFQDVPRNEPELVQELLQPWPDRALVYRAFNHLHQMTSFAATSPMRKSSG